MSAETQTEDFDPSDHGLERVGHCNHKNGCGATFEYGFLTDSDAVYINGDCPECGNGQWGTAFRTPNGEVLKLAEARKRFGGS